MLERFVAQVAPALPAEWAVFSMGTKAPFAPAAIAAYDWTRMDGLVAFEAW